MANGEFENKILRWKRTNNSYGFFSRSAHNRIRVTIIYTHPSGSQSFIVNLFFLFFSFQKPSSSTHTCGFTTVRSIGGGGGGGHVETLSAPIDAVVHHPYKMHGYYKPRSYTYGDVPLPRFNTERYTHGQYNMSSRPITPRCR